MRRKVCACGARYTGGGDCCETCFNRRALKDTLALLDRRVEEDKENLRGLGEKLGDLGCSHTAAAIEKVLEVGR